MFASLWNTYTQVIIIFTLQIGTWSISRLYILTHQVLLDNGKITLIPALALREATYAIVLTYMKVTIKYNH
jgi:hypothetical protein